MTSFYKPIILKIVGKSAIIYPCIGLEKVLDRADKKSIGIHLTNLYESNKDILSKGEYHIIILWDESTDDSNSKSQDIMSDVWIFDKTESWGAGPLVDVKTFRNTNIEENNGITTGDGLVMLGREEEFRRNSSSLEEYISNKRPELPNGINPTEEF